MKRLAVASFVILFLCTVTTSYGVVIGDFESGLDNWVAGFQGSPTLSTSTVNGVTSGSHSLAVKIGDSSGYWGLQWNAPSVPTLPAGTRLIFDLTMVQSEWPGGTWTKVADKVAINSNSPAGWKEFTPPLFFDTLTGAALTAADWGGWSPTITKTYSVDISSYNLTGATWFQLIISIQENSATGAGYFYFDNIRLGLPGPDYAASNPRPADGATDVRRDAVMTWTPNKNTKTHDVYFGTTFNDVNNASRANPLGVLMSQDQDANSFDPNGLFAFGQTCYWRVDEVNAPPSSAVHKGVVWSFTAEPLVYTMTNVTATASSTAPLASAQNTANGNGLTGDLHSDLNTAMWLSAATGPQPTWIQYAFQRVSKLDSMWVWNYNAQFEDLVGLGIKDALVEYSIDGTTWTKLGTFTFPQAAGVAGYAHGATVSFGGVAAKYVKITAVSNWGGNAQFGLSEVRFFHIIDWAREPQPTSGVTGLTPNVNLSWRAGREAATHDIYLGTDPNVLPKNGTSAVPSYALTGLNLGTKYYWRVDEVNAAASPATWTGDVWNFATNEYVVIDDMEKYTDDQGNSIYETWTDGYGTTTNGGLVGWDNPPFAEKTIVHGGKQSMPFRYNNTKTAFSEATRTYSTAQDWSVGGADTLSLYVHGEPTNFIQNNGTILMNGLGADIWGVADQFHFAYKQLTGDGWMIAKVEGIDRTNDWAKCGVMIRSTLDAGAMYADCVVGAVGSSSFQVRSANGGNSVSTDVTNRAAPYWVKIARSGNVFTAALSPDGVTWTAITPASTMTTTMTMPSNVFIGLAVCSHDAKLVTQARFSNISASASVTGEWKLADVGVVQPAGNGLDTLYLTIEDSQKHSKAVTATDPYMITSGSWQQWKIPLSAFSSAGVKLNSVSKIIVGVGDKTKAASGAAGTLYIDDIMFGHPAQ
jgi:hypothetical protein